MTGGITMRPNPVFVTFALILISSVLLAPSTYAGWEVGYITDPLRNLTNQAAQFDFLTRVIVFLFSAAVALVGVVAWRRNPSTKVKWIALAFGLLAFKWALKVMDLFVSSGQFFPDHAENVIELISLALIAYAIFAPKGK